VTKGDDLLRFDQRHALGFGAVGLGRILSGSALAVLRSRFGPTAGS